MHIAIRALTPASERVNYSPLLKEPPFWLRVVPFDTRTNTVIRAVGTVRDVLPSLKLSVEGEVYRVFHSTFMLIRKVDLACDKVKTPQINGRSAAQEVAMSLT